MPILTFDSSFTPLSRPATIEIVATIVRLPRIARRNPVSFDQPNSADSPAATCDEPRPSETATPNSVPRMETMSIVLPTGP